MAFDDKIRRLSAGEQAPTPELFRQMLGTMVQEAIRAEFDRFLGAAPYEIVVGQIGHQRGEDLLRAEAAPEIGMVRIARRTVSWQSWPLHPPCRACSGTD